MATRIEVKYINRSDRQSAYERIKNIGGKLGSHVWKHTQEFAIDWIEAGTFFYFVNRDGHEVDVIIATSADGRKYLKTVADEEQPNILLSLPECPS